MLPGEPGQLRPQIHGAGVQHRLKPLFLRGGYVQGVVINEDNVCRPRFQVSGHMAEWPKIRGSGFIIPSCPLKYRREKYRGHTALAA